MYDHNYIFESCIILGNNTLECGTLKHVIKSIIGKNLN